MKIRFVVLAGTLAACASASNQNTAATLPLCVQQRIDSIKARPVQAPPATVYRYQYKGKTVYAFNAPCCDQYNAVVDADCRYLCAPSGGFTGRGDGKCPDFKTAATDETLIWKDERGSK